MSCSGYTSLFCLSCLEIPCVCDDTGARCHSCRRCSTRYRDRHVCNHCGHKRFAPGDIGTDRFNFKHTNESRAFDERIRDGYKSRIPKGGKVTVVADEDAQRLHHSQTNCVDRSERRVHQSPSTRPPCQPRQVSYCATSHFAVDGAGNAVPERGRLELCYLCDPADKTFKAFHLHGPKRE